MTILYFFLFLWVIFALLDPDPDPATQYGSGSKTLLQTFHGSTLSLHVSIVSVHGTPWLHFKASTVLEFWLWNGSGSSFPLWYGSGSEFLKWCHADRDQQHCLQPNFYPNIRKSLGVLSKLELSVFPKYIAPVQCGAKASPGKHYMK
jgi:hypothetical protein